MTASVVVRSPAKINLALAVGPRRPDGFHDLATVYQAVAIYDEVRASAAPPGTVELTVEGPAAAAVPRDEANLAVRAAHALAGHCGVDDGVRLQLRKDIPVAGGMAGGSTDAAAALVACDALWRTRLPRARLLDLAAGLGSDVPFCLLGGTVLGSGHGEAVSSVLARGTYHWVFAFSADGLSTPAVYAELDRRRAGSFVPAPRVPPKLMSALATGDARALGLALENDLQPVATALRPALRRVLDAGRDLGALGALVSGSGPTCMFLARDQAHALDLAVGLTTTGDVRLVRHAVGPVAGARVVDRTR